MREPVQTLIGVSFCLVAMACGRPPAEAPPLALPPVVAATGAEIARAVRASSAPAVLVNLWATWCIPCREEFPDLMKLRQNYHARGLEVVFVSWDNDPVVAQRFLAQQGVEFKSYIKSDAENDPSFIDGLEPQWSGVFPATFIYDSNGALRHAWEGKQPYETFERGALDVLNPQP